jgi:hypothetical protein
MLVIPFRCVIIIDVLTVKFGRLWQNYVTQLTMLI